MLRRHPVPVHRHAARQSADGAAPPAGSASRVRARPKHAGAPAKLEEARRSGNIDFDLHADWVDYEAAGVENAEELSTRIVELLTRLDFEADVYNFGLRWRFDASADTRS